MTHIREKWVLLGLCGLLAGYQLIQLIQLSHYNRLDALLAAQNWQEADRQTTRIILQETRWGLSNAQVWGMALLSGELTGWYDPIHRYPCSKLQRLDGLWLQHSGGRFGLSVQQQIFERVAKQFNDEFDLYGAFEHEVQWTRRNPSVGGLSEFPVGHFPSQDWVQATTVVGKGEPWMLSAKYLYDRIQECQMAQ
ncbi:GUN4 domain-containing protein [Leptolyngbya sp. AN02str]|uniref:GUN4 domain-containing protein n=1 Tax=Leptolyngbya sp. AN02str TaxID=3423363 RepID=UPI003D31B319